MATDELDKKLLAKLGWNAAVTPEELDRLLEEKPVVTRAEASASSAPPQTARNLREESRARSSALAREAQAAWAKEGEGQLAALRTLGEHLGEAGFSCFGLDDQPLTVIRIVRMFVRHSDAFTDEELIHALFVVPEMIEPHPELATLVLELVEKPRQTMFFLLRKVQENDSGRFTRTLAEVAPGLARLLETSSDPAVRAAAADMLNKAHAPVAVRALRGALRERHLAVREAALGALLEYDPVAATEEDVLFLLEDAAVHPLPDRYDEWFESRADRYAYYLARVAEAVRPKGGAIPLACIARGESLSPDRGSLCDNWAVETAAAAYPEQSLPLVDEFLGNDAIWSRRHGVLAAAKLPWEQARPRLLRAASDAAYEVAEAAREAWRGLRCEPCPAGPSDGLHLDLLEAAPSEQFEWRLAILRGESREAKKKLMPVLLEEAPSREALVLVLYALEDTATFGYGEEGVLPRQDLRGGWLYDRFGAAAVEGLLRLGTRYPHGYSHSGFHMLHDLARRDGLPEEVREQMRRLAARSLARDGRAHRIWDGALGLLEILGSPAEYAEELVRLMLYEFRRSRQHSAGNALSKTPSAKTALLAAMHPLDETAQWRRALVAADVAARGGWSEARELSLQLLRQAPSAVAEEAEDLGGALFSAGWVDESEEWEWLSATGDARFDAAARHLKPQTPEQFERLIASLEGALSSTERAGRTAAVAARRLIWEGRLALDSPALLAAVRGAPVGVRCQLLSEGDFHFELIKRPSPMAGSDGADQTAAQPLVEMRERWAMTEAIQAEVVRVLVDPQAQDDAWQIATALCGLEEGRAVLLRALPQVPSAELRETIASDCRVPTEAALYWLDSEDPEKELRPAHDEAELDGDPEVSESD